MPSIPTRWSSFRVQRQGEQDYACALYCVVSAAIHIGTIKNDGGGVARTINAVGLERSGAFSRALFTSGVTEKAVRQLAGAAGLQLWRPNKKGEGPGLDDLGSRLDEPENETLWMVLLRVGFADPATGEIIPCLHYVLVLDVTPKGVVVADPHPARKPLYVMPKKEFLSAWDAARGPHRPRWAGCLGAPRT